MIHEAAVAVHVAAGSIGILSGFAALSVRKGARLHNSAGTVFLVSMLIMAGFAAVLAFLGAQRLNTIAAVFTLYLVATAWMTVRRAPGTIGRFEVVAMLVSLSVVAAGVTFGLRAASPAGLQDGDPESGNSPTIYFVFAGVAALAAVMDLRVIRRGGLFGAQRIARHLWRMCLALFIAAGSFFLGQQDEFPRAVQGSPVLLLPALAPLVLMVFWLLRVRFTNAFGWGARKGGIPIGRIHSPRRARKDARPTPAR